MGGIGKVVGIDCSSLLRDKKSAPLIKDSWSQEQNKQENTTVHVGGELVCGMPHR